LNVDLLCAIFPVFLLSVTFPNSATLSLTTVNLTDDPTPSVSSRAGDTSMMHLGALDFGSLHSAPPLPHEMRLRGGSIDRQHERQKHGGGQHDDDAELDD